MKFTSSLLVIASLAASSSTMAAQGTPPEKVEFTGGRGNIRGTDLHHTSDYTPYEGLDVSGAVRDVFMRGRAVIRAGIFVGRRGTGGYLEREQPVG